MKRFLTILAFASLALCSFSVSSMAQSSVLSIEKPQSWASIDSAITEHRIASFENSETQDRIEVYKREVVQSKHANMLFEAFEKNLSSNGFVIEKNMKNREFELKGGTTRKGDYTEFAYTSSKDIKLQIVTYSFEDNNIAYIVVGYFVSGNGSDGIAEYETLIKNMVSADN